MALFGLKDSSYGAIPSALWSDSIPWSKEKRQVLAESALFDPIFSILLCKWHLVHSSISLGVQIDFRHKRPAVFSFKFGQRLAVSEYCQAGISRFGVIKTPARFTDLLQSHINSLARAVRAVR
jgi:hypothetical protein